MIEVRLFLLQQFDSTITPSRFRLYQNLHRLSERRRYRPEHRRASSSFWHPRQQRRFRSGISNSAAYQRHSRKDLFPKAARKSRAFPQIDGQSPTKPEFQHKLGKLGNSKQLRNSNLSQAKITTKSTKPFVLRRFIFWKSFFKIHQNRAL